MIDHFSEFEGEMNRGQGRQDLPMGFTRLSKHVGLRRAVYYLIGAYTGSGKTSILDDAWVLNPYDYYLAHTVGFKFKVIYFSMERKKTFKIAKWVARKIFLNEGIIIPVEKIMGWRNEKLTPGEKAIIIEYRGYINDMLNTVVDMIEGPQNPMGIKKYVDAYAAQNGRNERISEHKTIYVPNDPSEIVLIVYDHIGLQKAESRKDLRYTSKKEIIDLSSGDAQGFRDFYGYSPVKVSQFNRDIANPTRIKNGDVEPMLEDFKDSGGTQEDADIVLSLFDPMRYRVEDPLGYNLKQLRHPENGMKMYRFLRILKNTYGSDDIGIGMAFQPQLGMFKEMPRKAGEMREEDYNYILSSSYFI